jgi:hypothetical protein
VSSDKTRFSIPKISQESGDLIDQQSIEFENIQKKHSPEEKNLDFEKNSKGNGLIIPKSSLHENSEIYPISIESPSNSKFSNISEQRPPNYYEPLKCIIKDSIENDINSSQFDREPKIQFTPTTENENKISKNDQLQEKEK